MGRFVKNYSLNNGGVTNSIIIPTGSTASQPANPVVGTLRYNSTLNMLEFYNGSQFVQLQGGTNGTSNITRDSFTIGFDDDGSTIKTEYHPLSFTPTNATRILVFMEGVFQKDDTYTINTDSTETYIRLFSLLNGDLGKTLTVLHGFDKV